MLVLVLSSVPEGLRGHVTRWLLEISPGVFVGQLSARVRDRLWETVTRTMGEGRAVMVFRARNEQGLQFLTWGDPWMPTDFEGLTLIVRPGVEGEGTYQVPNQTVNLRRRGTSDFEKRRQARRGFPRSDRSVM
ncbi:type I-E CRISPR-associated endoribonuclease Cas2e [Schaalia suimastitidis]|uniref:type I-E CRISPR-associated endoribonuclease Cas2e n=1 Tax=Schaalia suimastitidis TaxID=121163 RepID=UPI0003FD868F|nr:type I-E CRISPR-associated endoribonuclease Cas2e [Schaalia suimastitidis]